MMTALHAEPNVIDTNNSINSEGLWPEEDPQTEASHMSTEPDEVISWGYYRNLDFYYSNFGIFYNFDARAIPDIGVRSEPSVYLDLLKRANLPQYILFEISINPIPTLGTYFRRQYATTYNKISLKNNINLVESVTAGFAEPYAMSVFLNNMVTYGAQGDPNNLSRGFMGYLLSVGTYHIQRNRLVKDNWLELEWKIKGDIQQQAEKLNWSFRFGGKFHNHPEITNTFYIALRRIQTSEHKPILSWIYNTGYEFTYSVDQTRWNPVGLQIFLDKKIPLSSGHTILSIGVGLVHETNAKYRGELRKIQNRDNQTFLAIRPSIDF